MMTVVVGQVARDLVLCVDRVPGRDEAVAATHRREVLGGKGANIAVGLAQLGTPVALLGVVGDDAEVLGQARDDGVDVAWVVHRRGAATGLVVDIVDGDGHWHYVEHLPAEVLLTEDDIKQAQHVLRAAACVVVQLQQPADAALAAVHSATGLVVLDGVPEDAAILAGADVLRADATEARLVTGAKNAEEAIDAGRELVTANDMTLVAFGVDGGDVFVWQDGASVFPHGDEPVVDTTGAGDALTAALTTALLRGGAPEEAAELAVAAAAATVRHPGGRPDLTHLRRQAG
jgi:ribokinase